MLENCFSSPLGPAAGLSFIEERRWLPKIALGLTCLALVSGGQVCVRRGLSARPSHVCGSRGRGTVRAAGRRGSDHRQRESPRPRAATTPLSRCPETQGCFFFFFFFLLLFDISCRLLYILPPPHSSSSSQRLFRAFSCSSHTKETVSLWHLSRMKRVRREKLPLNLSLFNMLYEKILNCIKLS